MCVPFLSFRLHSENKNSVALLAIFDLYECFEKKKPNIFFVKLPLSYCSLNHSFCFCLRAVAWLRVRQGLQKWWVTAAVVCLGVGAVSEMSCGAKGQDIGLSGYPRGLTTGEQSFNGSNLKVVISVKKSLWEESLRAQTDINTSF